MKLLVLWAILTLRFGINQAALSILKWNKRLGDFEPFPGFPSWEIEKERDTLDARNEETHNFNRQDLNLTYYEEPNFVHFYKNDTEVTGIVGDIWTTLSKSLNFTLVVTKSKKTSSGALLANGSFSGLLDLARLNQTDIIPKLEAFPNRLKAAQFTSSFWINEFRIFKRVQPTENRTWMFHLFSVEIWWLIFISILTLSLASAVMQRVRIRPKGRKLRPRSYADHLFNTFGMACNQGSMAYMANGSKILMVTISLFSWVILVAYSSRLISNITQPIYRTPIFANLDDFIQKTNLKVVVMQGSMCHLFFSNFVEKPSRNIKGVRRSVVASDLDDVYDKVCLNSDKYVLCDGVNEVASRSANFCSLIPVGQINQRVNIVSGVSRRVKNKRSLDIGIMKLREFGIIDALKKRYLSSKTEIDVREVDSLAIGMNQVSLIIAILGFGIVASIVICIAENIFFALKKRKTNQCLIQRYPRTLHNANSFVSTLRTSVRSFPLKQRRTLI